MALTVTGAAVAGVGAVAATPWARRLNVRQIAISNAVHLKECVEFIWGAAFPVLIGICCLVIVLVSPSCVNTLIRTGFQASLAVSLAVPGTLPKTRLCGKFWEGMISVMPDQIHKLRLRCLLSWLIVLGLLAVSSGNAQSTAKKHKPCGDYGTQSEMNQCAAEEAKSADDALNRTYREFLAKLKGDETATTRAIAAEKAWIAFRDAELASDWPVANGENPNIQYGSVHPFCYYNELAALTWDRIRVLRGRMKREEEGDVCSIQVATRLKGIAPHQGCSSAAS